MASETGTLMLAQETIPVPMVNGKSGSNGLLERGRIDGVLKASRSHGAQEIDMKRSNDERSHLAGLDLVDGPYFVFTRHGVNGN